MRGLIVIRNKLRMLFRLKAVLLGVLVLNLAAPCPALADWQPTFNPDQAVYVDPALVQNPTAPVKFGPELEDSVQELRGQSGINIFVQAVETTKQATAEKGLGVIKTQDAISAWNKLADFPRDNYALIVWARRADDLKKGGLGMKLSSNLQKFDIKPTLKAFMPQDPEGAILSIANKIAAQAVDPGDISPVIFLCLLGVIVLSFGLLAVGLNWKESFKTNSSYKEEAEKLIERWSIIAKNCNDIYLELTASSSVEFLSKLYRVDKVSLEETPEDLELRRFLDQVRAEIHQFLCLFLNLEAIVEKARSLAGDEEYKKALTFLAQSHVVRYGKVPVEKASIYTGFSDDAQYKGADLIAETDRRAQSLLKSWGTLKGFLDSPDPIQAVGEYLLRVKAQNQRELITAALTQFQDQQNSSTLAPYIEFGERIPRVIEVPMQSDSSSRPTPLSSPVHDLRSQQLSFKDPDSDLWKCTGADYGTEAECGSSDDISGEDY